MTLTHILVDFENTQPSADDIALLRGTDQHLWIFRGPSQKKYDAEFAEALLALGKRLDIIKCAKSGRNALDMHIAMQIGRLLGEPDEGAAATPSAAFVVVSRDTDYEPLLQYVRAQGYDARRVTSIREALGAKAAKARPAPAAKAKAPAAKAKAAKKAPAKSAAAKGALEELVETVAARLRDHPKNRPTRRDRMESWLASHLRSKLAGVEVAAIVTALENGGVVRFAGNKIEYPQWP